MEIDVYAAVTSVLGIIGASSVISGVILRRIDRLERGLERRERDLVEENLARGEVIHCAGRLAEANTVALRAVTSEEVCETELAALRRASDKLEHFTREKSAVYLHADRIRAS